MRKIAVIGLIVLALGAVAVIVPAKAAQKSTDRVARPRQLTAQGRQLAPKLRTSPDVSAAPQAAGDVVVFNESFFTQTFNHFANPSLGSVIAETWGEDGVTADNVFQDTQGVSRAFLLPKATRVSLKTTLIGFSGFALDDPHVVATSSTINSSGALTVQARTPEIGLGTSPDCFFVTTVHMGIRWSDGRLSTVDFSMDFVYPNQRRADDPACMPPA